MTGVKVLYAIACMQLKNIKIAVACEDDKYSIDFEAILTELTQLTDNFAQSHKNLYNCLNRVSPGAFDSGLLQIDCDADGISNEEHATSIESILQAIVDSSPDFSCSMCRQRLHLGSSIHS